MRCPSHRSTNHPMPRFARLSLLRSEEGHTGVPRIRGRSYPLLIEIFDRVARELIKEGVDLRRLADGDLSVFEHRTPTPARA